MRNFRMAVFTWRRATAVPWLAAAALAAVGIDPAAATTIAAIDAGFVTIMGGSAKGDGTASMGGATYNYSVGYEVHYASGALSPPPYAPMPRRNYFVFDLSGVTVPAASVTLKLWTGKLESVDPFEVYALAAPSDMAAALPIAAHLASGTSTADFDSPDDPLVIEAKDLFPLLGTGPMLAMPLVITSAMDSGFIDLVFTPSAVTFINGFLGAKVMLSGLVPTIDGMPPMTPQQPFGFTGPDIPGGGPLTPKLILTPVPEPGPAPLLLLGGGTLLLILRRRR